MDPQMYERELARFDRIDAKLTQEIGRVDQHGKVVVPDLHVKLQIVHYCNLTRRINDATERALSTFTDDARAALSQPEKLHLAQQQLRREAEGEEEVLQQPPVVELAFAFCILHDVRHRLVCRLDAR
jgi:hypothetical protein